MILMITPFEPCSKRLLEQIMDVANEVDGVILRLNDSNEHIGHFIQKLKQVGLSEKIIVHNQPALLEAFKLKRIHFKESYPLIQLFKHQHPNVKVGMSTHSIEQVRMASDMQLDYCIFGHIFHTTSKLGVPPRTKEEINAIFQYDIPVIAIGGISQESIKTLDSRFSGFSGIRLFLNKHALIETKKEWLLRIMK